MIRGDIKGMAKLVSQNKAQVSVIARTCFTRLVGKI